MPPSKAAASASSRKPPLTLAELSSYDDMLTDALVDRAFYWTNIPKNRPSYHASRGVKEEEITGIIQNHLIVNPDLQLAVEKLLATEGIRRFCSALQTPKQKADFTQHLQRYARIYLPDCPFEVSSTNRYTITTHEASVVARRYIKRNESIKYLAGIQVVISPEQEARLADRKKDFSVVVSSRNRLTSIFMGPARFANHDCGANAKLVNTGPAGIDIVAVRSIHVGEDITVTYGDNYFGENNCECLCQTCEDNLANGWKQPEGFVPVKQSIESGLLAAQGYNTRGKGRLGREESRSSTPSITPDLRPKVPRSKARRLLCEGDRASTTDSAFQRPGTALKRTREPETLATPPFTPAKKQRTTQHQMAPAPLRRERCISSEDELGGSTSSSESSGGYAVLTDATTPEDTTDAADDLLKPVFVSQAIEGLKLEPDGDESCSAGLHDVLPFIASANLLTLPAPLRQTPRATDRAPGMSIRDILNTPSEAATTPHGQTPNDRDSARASKTLSATDAPQASAARAVSPDPLSSVGVHPASSPPASARRGRPRGRKNGANVLSLKREASTPPAAHTDNQAQPVAVVRRPTHRIPGDYELTRRLLAEPDMAWVRCMICSTAFVQQNAYYTRSSCPRCERHSKLYGYVWPKTQRDGPWDKEERVLDHRTIHRFLALDDELLARGRAAVKKAGASAPGRDESGRVTKRGRRKLLVDDDAEWTRDSSASTTGPDVRRSGRRRTASQRITDDI